MEKPEAIGKAVLTEDGSYMIQVRKTSFLLYIN